MRARLLRRAVGRALHAVAGACGLREALRYVRAGDGLSRHAEPGRPTDGVPQLAAQAARAVLDLQAVSRSPDHVWPFWVQRQLDPDDPAFVPRGTSPVWFNLGHRDWTAVGVLRGRHEPVVDPRGMLTARHEGWSLDLAVEVDGHLHAPARLRDGYRQTADTDVACVRGAFDAGPVRVETLAWAERVDGLEVARLQVRVHARRATPCTVRVSLRPCNPEGTALVHRVRVRGGRVWEVDGQPAVVFAAPPARHVLLAFDEGDALVHEAPPWRREVACSASLATAAACFDVTASPGGERVDVAALVEPEQATPDAPVRLAAALEHRCAGLPSTVRRVWEAARAEVVQLVVPEGALQDQLDHAVNTLLLLDDGDVLPPGPLTAHQHDPRQLPTLLPALARLGLGDAARRKVRALPALQHADGAWRGADGSCDGTAPTLWAAVEVARILGDEELLAEVGPAVLAGARWIARARRGPRSPGRHGLLPPSAAQPFEPVDFQYGDTLWGVAALRRAARVAGRLGDHGAARELAEEAQGLWADLDQAWILDTERLGGLAVPAGPGRRYDAGMVGVLAAAWPLGVLPSDHPRLAATLAHVRARCFHDGALRASHGGLDVGLTLQCAQVMLEAGDVQGAAAALDRVARLARPTGVWPEAVHPRTGGGCAGDGHHGGVAAGFLLLVLRGLAQERGDTLELFALGQRSPGTRVEGLPTRFGPISLRLDGDRDALRLTFAPAWREAPREVAWRVPEAAEVEVDGRAVTPEEGRILVPRDGGEVTVRRPLVLAPRRPAAVRVTLQPPAMP